MSKVQTDDVGQFMQHYPKTATVVTVQNGGRQNALAIAWHTSISFDPPLYGVAISPKRFSHGLIREAKEFVVNFLAAESCQLIAAVGRTSGRDFDKFEKFQIAQDAPMIIKSPILRDAYAAYECELVEQHTYGDHDMFLGKVVAVHHLGDVLDERGILDLDQVNPAFYMGADYYSEMGKTRVRHFGHDEAMSYPSSWAKC